jgi:hypothetical protein
VRTLASAAALLARGTSLDDLVDLARIAGFTNSPLELDHDARRALAVDDLIDDARVVEGRGTLRALVARTRGTESLRATMSELAARLGARAPQLLWLVIAGDARRDELAIGAWSAERARPRVAMLLVERAHVAPSDAETLCALESAATANLDLLAHARWVELLGREALTRRFYRALEQVVRTLGESAAPSATPADRLEIALLHVSRLLFISFLEAKGWMNGDRTFLLRRFGETAGTARGFHRGVLLPLFFGTLNTPHCARSAVARAFGRVPFLNGGLFARAPVERRRHALHFPDDALSAVFDQLLTRYRFTARESSERWSEAAIDPEMLGRAFESLMASRERRASGAFYTPHRLVEAVTSAALAQALGGAPLTPAIVDAMLRGERPAPEAAVLVRQRLLDLRLLDPACGSGAFLVHALDALAVLLAGCGDLRRPVVLRRELLTRAIFGVDINPTAVWLCELRLWLSVVIESDEADPLAVAPLPNLDRHVRVGDALSGEAFSADVPRTPHPSAWRAAALRQRYARASGARKRSLERELDRVERRAALDRIETRLDGAVARRRELIIAARSRDLFGERHQPPRELRDAIAGARAEAASLRAARDRLRSGGALPFAFATHFPDIAAGGGFDVVVGNPPWVRLHRIPPADRAAYRHRYSVFRGASWTRGAVLSNAGPGFASQVDLAALFTERSLRLLRPDGVVALLLPTKLWRSLAGGGVRQLLHNEARLLALEDWSDSPTTFDAAVYPSVMLARRASGDGDHCIEAAIHHRTSALRWQITSSRLGLDAEPASPWLLLRPEVRAAFDRLTAAGIPLAESALGRPALGVKCGLNEAFVVTVEGGDDVLARVRAGERVGVVERALLRPLLRGETIGDSPREWIIWTHGADAMPLPSLPPHAGRWLSAYRARLVARSDARHSRQWWSLFRISGASAHTARVVWADVARVPRAVVLPAGDPTVALNSCYVLPCAAHQDALTLATLLSSPLMAAWLNALAEPARGGYRRYMAWTVALMPIPTEWYRARHLLVPPPEQAGELLAATLRCFRLRHGDVAPLLAWNAR